jgi:hypothetical protein
LLEVEDLHVNFETPRNIVRAVEGLSFQVGRGEVVAIVGESGSGKSVSALAIMRLLPRLTGRTRGRITFDGKSLLDLNDEKMRQLRGRDISMIFQEPMTSLNPLLTIGLQVTEPLTIHLGMIEAQARARAIELFRGYGWPLAGSQTLQINTRVGASVNGSRKAVVGSGTTSMSLSWISWKPRIDEPSKPMPSAKPSRSRALGGIEKCCHKPNGLSSAGSARSMNGRARSGPPAMAGPVAAQDGPRLSAGRRWRPGARR